MSTTLVHAHISEQSRDCDGTYSSGRMEVMTHEEQADEFGDLHFQQRILGNVVTLHGQGRLEVTPEGLSWHERTDEGFRAADVRWCTDECANESAWQRDHRAEEMGY